jgi:hypothetical protein
LDVLGAQPAGLKKLAEQRNNKNMQSLINPWVHSLFWSYKVAVL